MAPKDLLSLFAVSCAVAGFVLLCLAPGRQWGQDFPAFLAAGHLTLNGGAASAYDPAAYQAAIESIASGAAAPDLYWMYPPHAAPFVAALAALPEPLAITLWLVLTLAALAWMGRVSWGSFLGILPLTILSLPPLICLLFGQMSGAFAALLMLGGHNARRRPVLAGIAFALLTIKPSYGLLVPVFLLSLGAWRTVAVAMLGTGVLFLGSVIVADPEAWPAWWQAREVASGFMFEEPQANMPSVYQYGLIAGIPPSFLPLLQLAAVGVGGWAVWRARVAAHQKRLAALLAGTALALPYGWFYDWIIVVAAGLLVARVHLEERHSWTLAGPVLALVWSAPILSAFFAGNEADYALINLVNGVELAGLVGLLILSSSGDRSARSSEISRWTGRGGAAISRLSPYGPSGPRRTPPG